MKDETSNKLEVSLNSLPNEILQRIISCAGVKNIIQLLSDRAFLQSNQGLKSAINHQVEEKSCYEYSSQVADPRLGMKKHMFWDASQKFMELWKKHQALDFDNYQSFLEFYNYCVEERLVVNCKIAYDVSTIVDFIEYEEIMSKLRNCGSIGLLLSLNFKKLGFIENSRILKSFSHVRDRVLELSLAGLENMVLDLNSRALEGIPLRISDCEFSSSLTSCSNLIELTLHDQSFDIVDLPQSLKILHLYYCFIHSSIQDRRENRLPILTHLTFHHDDDYIYDGEEGDIEDVENALRDLITAEMKSIEFMSRGKWGYDEWFVEMLKDISTEKGLQLESLSLNGRFEDPLICSSRSFKFKIEYDYYLRHYDISEGEYVPCPELCRTLETLSLYGPEIKASDLLKVDPASLEYLYLYGCCVNEKCDLSNFKKLKYLHLREAGLKRRFNEFFFPKLLEVLLPRSLEVLILTDYDQKLINQVAFPDNLTILRIHSYRVASLDEVTFPPSLMELDLEGSEIHHLRGEVFPSTLKRLYVGVTESVDLSKDRRGNLLQLEELHLINRNENGLICTLPTSLRSLKLDSLGSSVFNEIGDELVWLKLDHCSFDLRDLKLGSKSKLSYLCMSGCVDKTLDIDLPQSLTEVILDSNDFSEFPTQIGHLKNLRIFKYSSSEKKLNIEFFHNSLEVLSIDCPLYELELKFPEGDTKLKQLNLSMRGLKDLTMESIGHKESTKHSSLLSINCKTEKAVTEEELSALVPTLPKSMVELRACRGAHEETENCLSR
ncbi:hypothetical protein I9W82_001434 [Candida metapsilosis]|uniref:F-box domain-containing protein n=1 Tax=Candida metapsilosis TaxID=273372 RepID=A0A8H7ZKT6_9ASCO|nr:hypothetical protein I9W82_001434 [Candida metapsilosis]